MATGASGQNTRRSGEPVDAGVPISDLERDGLITLRDDAKPTEIRHRWQAGIDSSRDLRLRQWVRNILMTYGEQDVHWSQRADRWLTVPLKRIRRYRTNLLPGRLSHHAAKMTQTAPEWTALPYNDTIEAEQTAKSCDKLLRHDYRALHMDLARYFATIQQWLFGFGIIELLVDEEAEVVPIYEQELGPDGNPAVDQRTGMPLWKQDKNGRPKIKEVEMKPGIKCRPVSPFSFVVPPGMEWPLLDDAPYCIRASWASESYVRRRYDVPKSVNLVSDSYGNYEAMTSYLWQVLNPQTLPVNRFEAGRVLLLQYFERARDVKGYYEGKIYTVCGNELIGDERSLWDDGGFPFFMFSGLPVPDSFYPFPGVNPATDPQSRINQTVTHQMDHLGRVGSPVIIADRSSGFPQYPQFQYGVYFTSPGLRRPEFMQAPSMPTGAYQMGQMAKADMDDALTQYPPARGQSAGQSITSGLHARLVQDADQTEMGPLVRLHAHVFAQMGERLLELHRLYDDKKKLLHIIGADGDPELFEFETAEIPLKQRVMVQEDSLLVHYRSALVEEANQLASAGAFGNMVQDPAAQRKYLKAIRSPHLAGPLTPEEVQQQYIDQIHFKIIHEGKMPSQVEPWWNLQAHREAAQERLLRESLRWAPDVKQRFMKYWTVIEKAVEQQQAAAKKTAMNDAKEQMALQLQAAKANFEAEASAKNRTELLRGTSKLAVASLKEGNGAGGGATPLSLSSIPLDAESSNGNGAMPQEDAADAGQ